MTAVSYASEDTPAVGVEQIFQRALAFVRDEPGEFLGATLSLAIVPAILAEFPGRIGTAFNLGATFCTLAYAGIIAMLVYDHACQEPVRFERGARSLRRYRSLFALSMLGGLAIVLGLMALIVPGLFLICLWFVATPACAVEQLSFGKAMSRSAELTRGNRLRLLAVFVLCAVVMVAMFVVGALATGLHSANKPPVFTGAWFIQAAVIATCSVVMSIMTSLIPAAAYVELRRAREGTLSDGVAAVFG